MILAIDIGNTNITMGVFEEEFLLGMFRMTTKRARTSDEYGFTICGILEHRGIDSKQIDSVIVASVVPDIMHSFTSGIIKYLGTEPMIVSSQTDTGVRVVTENPTQDVLCGTERRCFRRFRSEDRNPCLHRRRLAECRQDLYTERSDRRNI